MIYTVKRLSCDPTKLQGLSEKLIVSHYINNYCGAVKRLNLLTEQLQTLDYSRAFPFLINGLKREELIAMNSMILHELYFDSLGGNSAPGEALIEGIARDFGSLEKWHTQFSAMGKALSGGSGWVLLAWLHRDSRLINHWCADHASGLAGATPILALDMFEHSYYMDYGAKAAAYVDAFMRNINWESVSRRYKALAAGTAMARPQVPRNTVTTQVTSHHLRK